MILIITRKYFNPLFKAVKNCIFGRLKKKTAKNLFFKNTKRNP